MRKHNKTAVILKDEAVQWIRDYFEKNGPKTTAVIGISGGKDSSVCAALCVEALGKERVMGVLMPNGEQYDINFSQMLVEHLGIKNITVNIQPYAQAFEKKMREVFAESAIEFSDQSRVNYPARLRMTTLYATAQSLPTGGRVVCTGNASEEYVGYSTKFGDGCGDFAPLLNLTVREVLEIGAELDLPTKFLEKPPEDGLSGKTDEDNLGFTYNQIDDYIGTGTCGDNEIDKVIHDKNIQNLHKLEFLPSYVPCSHRG